MSDNMPPLLPCPFCGAAPYEARHLEYGWWAASCKCGVRGPQFKEAPPNEHKHSAYAKATEAWNRRAAIAQAQSCVPAAVDIEDLKDRLVAISSAVADDDDRAAQAILRTTLELLAASPQPQPVQPSTRMWHDRIKDAHPTSDPQYWPNALKVEYMEQEILDLRALVAQPVQPERVPLTASEIAGLWDDTLFHITDLSTATDFVRDVEAAHGIAAPQPKD